MLKVQMVHASTLGSRIRSARESRRIKQAQLARLFKVGPTTV
jgi:transcriptional regulator with XRE-family HTH domain